MSGSTSVNETGMNAIKSDCMDSGTLNELGSDSQAYLVVAICDNKAKDRFHSVEDGIYTLITKKVDIQSGLNEHVKKNRRNSVLNSRSVQTNLLSEEENYRMCLLKVKQDVDAVVKLVHKIMN